ncbi:MAG: tryptophan synthase subunit alpha [Myxococcaceae bacterium]
MSRIAAAFAKGKSEKRPLLITYLCAGDPSLEASEALAVGLAEAGADIIEIGIPFSDPLADGPIIQAASQRALQRGVTQKAVLQLVARIRQRGVNVPLVLMGYMNPMVAMGMEAFCTEAHAAGADGLIIPDLPLDEADAYRPATQRAGLDLILLAAPTTPSERVTRISQTSSGFLYFVSVTGVTGSRTTLPPGLPETLAKVRAASRLPVAVGFGISQPEHVARLAPHADAIVVGSALVDAFHRAKGDVGPVLELTRALKAALKL